MSFAVETLLWLIRVFLLYFAAVFLPPAFVLRPVLRGKPFSQCFLICAVSGHFYIIFATELLALVHLTWGPALLLALLLPVIWRAYVSYREPIRAGARRFAVSGLRVLRRQISVRFCVISLFRAVRGVLRRPLSAFWRYLRTHFWEVLLCAGSACCTLWLFGSNALRIYGYTASDIVVHQEWLQNLSDGVLFSGGIYPMGMHCIIYFLHAVSGVPNVILMRLIPVAADFLTFSMIPVTLKVLCRFRYTPYLAYLALTLASFTKSDRLLRYFSALPQEFGMMFVLPCLASLVLFLRRFAAEEREYRKLKKEKLLYTRVEERTPRRKSTLWLIVLGMSFALTFAVHFYATIIAAVVLLGGAAGWCTIVFRPKCLGRAAAAALLSFSVAIFPMAVSFAQGTPLQGSLYWAVSVMEGDGEDETAGEQETVSSAPAGEDSAAPEDGAPAASESGEAGGTSGGDADAPPGAAAQSSPTLQERLDNVVQRITGVLQRVCETARAYFTEYLFESEAVTRAALLLFALLLAQIPLLLLLRQWEAARAAIAVFVLQAALTLLAAAEDLGLPVLIDTPRMSGFQTYLLPLLLGLSVDGALAVCASVVRVERLWRGVSLLLTASFLFLCVTTGHVRGAVDNVGCVQTNGAAICVYDIMERYPEQKWTIVSCNEERTMIDGTGWHYEVIDFLESMEDYDGGSEMRIPTQYVFFFIEKESLEYGTTWPEGTDPTAGEEWASLPLPRKSGISQYTGPNRIIVNSRLYYWAQACQEQCPNEMHVFYEDESFICYVMEQNEYALYNFAIDYGFNSGGRS